MKNELANKVLASLAVGVLCSSVAVCQAAGAENDDIVDVVVTAERMPSSRMSTPADVTVITAQQIEDNHYADVAEALKHITGVVVTNGNANGDQEVVLNGDTRVVVLIDGQRLNNAQGSMTRASASLGMLPSVKNVERIEVVKGAGSALYGSDAIGGVVNIITKKGDKMETTLDINTGSFGMHNYELTNQGVDNGWKWFVTAGMQKRSYLSYNGNSEEGSRMANSDYTKKSFSLRLDKQLSDNSSVVFNFNHRLLDMGTMGKTPDKRQEHNYNYGSITYNFKEDQAVPGFLRYSANYKATRYPSDYSTDGRYDTNTHSLEYQNGWQLDDKNTLVVGGEWRRSGLSNRDSGYVSKDITNKALFMQDTMKISNKWTFVPGLRMDHHSAFGTHWTPKAAFNYQASSKTRAYASWGRVFKAPTGDDMFYEDAWMKGDPNLKPESGHVETIGFTHEFSKKAVLDMSYFWSDIKDAIKWLGWDAASGKTIPINVYHEKKHGINISLNGVLSDHWSYEMGYSYIGSEINEVKDNYYEPNGYRFGLQYRYDRWKANIEARMGSGLAEASYGRNNYAIWNFNTTYAASKNVDIYFKVNNITNSMYYVVPKSKYTGFFYPLQGRTFLVGANVKF